MIRDGIIVINKPQNMTSHDVVAICRRTLGIKKIGHTGTLDPMATGVLPLCVGKATRIIEYLDLDMKKYRCKLVLGIETDTQDVWGQIIDQKPIKTKEGHTITEADIRLAFEPFKGVIDQKPPMYSALKVNGKRLYEYARAGETVQVKTRKIFIDNLDIEEICLGTDRVEGLESQQSTVTFTVTCSKGTYIRTICQDVGLALGCGASLAELTRLASGVFCLEEAITLEELENACGSGVLGGEQQIGEGSASAEGIILPIEYPLCHFGEVQLDQVQGARFANGWHIGFDQCVVVRQPEYKDKDFCLPIRSEYKGAYNMFTKKGETWEFIGVAFYNQQYKKLVADKVIIRG